MYKQKLFNGHGFIMGRTGTGKTYFANHCLATIARRPVLYFVSGHEDIAHKRTTIKADMNTNLRLIIHALKQNMDVAYTPSYHLKIARAELKRFQELIFADRLPAIIFMVDEAQRFAPQGSIDTACHLLATGGRRWNAEMLFISQRIADTSKTLITQCEKLYIFAHSPFDTRYLNSIGIHLSDENLNYLNKKYNVVLHTQSSGLAKPFKT